MSPDAVRRHLAIYRVLLVCYPRAFRRGYGDPMVQLFGDDLRAVGRRAWWRAGPDLVRSVPAQRIEALMRVLRSGGPLLAIAVVATAIVLVALGKGGPAVVIAAAFVAFVILASQRRVFAGALRGPQVSLRQALTQTWWAPIAGACGGLLVAAAVGNVFNATNTSGRIVGTIILFVWGLMMFVGLRRRPYARAAGNTFILIASAPGFVFFWAIWPAALSLLLWVGVLSSEASRRPVTG